MATSASDSSNTNFHDTPTTTKADERVLVGELLRHGRERRGMSLEQVATETKIPLRHLQALERDDHSVVPDGLYRRAKIRAYARAVHLDQVAFAQLEHALVAAEPLTLPPADPSAPTTAFQKNVLVALAVVGVALVVGLVTRGGDERIPETVQSNHTVDPAPTAPPAATVNVAQQTTPENELTPEAAVATVGGPLPQAAALPTTTDTEPSIAQPVGTELVITSEPPGARVTVDGIGWGITPVTVRHLPPGTKHIRVTKDGYQGEDRQARVGGDRPNELHIEMQAVP
jgi:cytoskeletal protein RodZ